MSVVARLMEGFQVPWCNGDGAHRVDRIRRACNTELQRSTTEISRLPWNDDLPHKTGKYGSMK